MLQPADSQTPHARATHGNTARGDSAPVYRHAREHLFEELRRLDLMLNLRIARHRRAAGGASFDEFRGLFISEEEIDGVLRQHTDAPAADAPADAETHALAAILAQLENRIAARLAATLRAGLPLPLARLAALFQLTRFDCDALLVCLAPELDLKYEKLYAYLQDDVTRKRPSTNLLLELFCSTLAEKLEARERLLPAAPLFVHQLVRYADDATHAAAPPFLSRVLKIDDRILQFLLDRDAHDEQLAAFAACVEPRAAYDDLHLPAEMKQSLARVFHSSVASLAGKRNGASPGKRDASAAEKRNALASNSVASPSRVFVFEGAAGVGKNTTAEALCASVGLNLIVADAARLASHAAGVASNVKRLLREARLRSAAVYFDRADALLGEGERERQARAVVFEALREFDGIAFVGSEQALTGHAEGASSRFFRISFPVPDYDLRRQLWEAFCAGGDVRVAAGVEREALADKFAFTAGRIHGALAEARHLAMLRDGDEFEITNDDLYRACRAQSSQRLAGLARKITPLYTWSDIVLPGNRLEHLREVCAHVKHRQRVFSEWGFERKIALGKGLGILFVGPSGTGKTMAAEIVAGELGLDLYKIELSSVVSKYIGETEKNLSRIFEEAEQSNAVLFFDEADAIFGKRSEVKDAHDRYANIETNYLLQRMEEYAGIIILASNFQNNIDEAFTRRIRFVIDFPFPDDAYRYHIWKKVFPEATPLAADIDFDFLAQKLKLTGGNIRNIALNAAFLAAGQSSQVRMEHLISATKREFQKMGRLCVKTDFGQYFEYVEREEEGAFS